MYMFWDLIFSWTGLLFLIIVIFIAMIGAWQQKDY